MALENYVEMMRSTGDPVFRSRKAIEAALERDEELGASFRSRYAMVCYGGGRQKGAVGYLDALKLGEAQWGVVCDLAEGFSGSDASEADAFLDRGRAAQLPRGARLAVTKAAGRRPRDRRDRLSFLKFVDTTTLRRAGRGRGGAWRWSRGSYKAATASRNLATCGESVASTATPSTAKRRRAGHARGLGLLEKGDHARP